MPTVCFTVQGRAFALGVDKAEVLVTAFKSSPFEREPPNCQCSVDLWLLGAGDLIGHKLVTFKML